MSLARFRFPIPAASAALLALLGLALLLALLPAAAQANDLAFSSTLENQAYTSGDTISLTLPVATGGSGSYTYRLRPSKPPAGITYDKDARTWTGTPTEAGPPRNYYWTAFDGTNRLRQKFTVSVTSEPEKPAYLDAEPAAASATLSWRPKRGTQNYVSHTTITKWQYRDSADGTFEECTTAETEDGCWHDISSSDKDTRSHEVTGLTNGTEYTFQVRAVNPTGDGAESDSATVTPLAAPAAPTDLAVARGNYKLTVTWKTTETVGAWWLRYVQDDSDSNPAFEDQWDYWFPISATKDDSTDVYSYDLTGLVNGAKYWVQVRGAVGTADPDAYGGLTGVVHGTPAAAVSGVPDMVLPTPTLTATAGTNPGTVTLQWDQAPDGVDVSDYEYRLRESGSTDDAWQYFGVPVSVWEETPSGDQHEYLVDGLTGGTEYDFQIRLTSPYGVSESSSAPMADSDRRGYSDFSDSANATATAAGAGG